ncbi:hypothetical protein [Shewanella algae]|uniref:hypothetical protein n=1 Tax=Shewanella algae TaxID=38313 RepID=UPI003BF4FE46
MNHGYVNHGYVNHGYVNHGYGLSHCVVPSHGHGCGLWPATFPAKTCVAPDAASCWSRADTAASAPGSLSLSADRPAHATVVATRQCR